MLQEGRRECLPVRGWRTEYLIFLTFKNCALFIFEYEIVMAQQRMNASGFLRRGNKKCGGRRKPSDFAREGKMDLVFVT